MTGEDRVERRLSDLEAMVFGIRGEGGLSRELGGLRRDFAVWRREDRERREKEANDKVLASRAIVLVLVTGLISLLAIIVALIGMVTQ